MPIKSKQPKPRLEDNEVYRRYYSQKERESMDAEDFAGPSRSFPIKIQQDVANAARLIGHADDPEAVKRKIIEIAKRKGFKLPKAWQDEEDKKSSEKRAATPRLARSATEHDGGHEDEDGDSVGIIVEEEDGENDEDGRSAMEIVDDNLADDAGEEDDEDTDIPELAADDPPEDEDQFDDLPPSTNPSPTKNPPTKAVTSPPRSAQPDITRTMPASDVLYYAPITRIDREKREIIGTATAEVKDSYGTVIGYEASRDALARWRGNVREMHDSTKAVGRALEVMPDPKGRRIIVRAKISKGAQDTWEKVLDGTLTGFSIGGRNGKWTEREINGEKLPYLERYDAVELSLVDNPACPGCNVEVVRADGLASDILAKDDEMPPIPKESPTTDVERAGARLSQETRDALHMARDHAKNAMSQTCATCGCDDCGDYIDALNSLDAQDDNDGDMDANYLAPVSMRKLIADIVRREITASLREQIAPTMQRVNALLASDASRSDAEQAPEITRRVDDISAQLSAIKALVEKIAAQPADGGPVLHNASLPAEKSLATQPAPRRAIDSEAIQRAMELGFRPPTDPMDQVKAAAAMVRPIPR